MINNAFTLMSLVCMLVLSGCGAENTDTDAGDLKQEGIGTSASSSDVSLALKPAQLDWVGQKIFGNECAGKFECLTHWNKAEAFPSLGIGHFIWYPEGVNERFVESFPALIEYMEQRQLNIPEWLRELEPFDAPWPDRQTFQQVADSPQVAELREFLAGTQGVQAEFIFRRAKVSLGKVVAAAPGPRQAGVKKHLQLLSQTPGGVYAIVDYVNFKGEGLSPDEQYGGEGWGLLQVLLAMPAPAEISDTEGDGPDTLAEFRAAARAVLTRRVENADNPVERDRWLAGWLKRVETYKEPLEMGSVPGVSS